MMRKADSLMLIWFCVLVLFAFIGIFYSPLTVEYFPDFIRGMTSAVSVTVAIIAFLLVSASREELEGISKKRIKMYLVCIVLSVNMVIVSYWQMIQGLIETSLFVMTFAVLVAFVVLFNLVHVYITPEEK